MPAQYTPRTHAAAPATMALAALALVVPSAALAHPGHRVGISAFSQGLAHPISGADHLAAMLLAGACAVLIGGAALWRLPLAILAGIAGGFVFAPLVNPAPAEALIALSVIACTALLALRWRPGPALAIPAFTLFGTGHGFAHGLEAAGGPSAEFALGMLLTSSALIPSGAGIAWLFRVALTVGAPAFRPRD